MWPFTTRYPEVNLEDVRAQYDYIVVGGGTAGCVLANRLSADPTTTVLLIERGPLADSWASTVPLLSSDFASDGSHTSKTKSVFQHEIGRPIDLFTGRALGGSSRINQMLYLRGYPAQYDAWEKRGMEGWGWKDMKGYFLKSERATYKCDPQIHGSEGEWYNCTNDEFHFPGFYHSIQACQALGLPYIDDINNPSHPPVGCGRLSFTRDPDARRHSSYHAFLSKALALARKANLHICTNALVEKLLVDTLPAGDLKVQGLSVSEAGLGESRVVRVGHEVVLCAGPFGSPHVLMLSGLGPAEHLKEHDIEVLKDLPAVGSNLQDHFGVSVGYRVPMAHSLLALERRPWIFILELFRYLILGKGMLLAPVLQLAIFASTTLLGQRGEPSEKQRVDSDTIPDIEIMPMSYDSGDGPFDKSRGVFSFLNVLLLPKSVGTVRLASLDPRAAPLVDPQYLADASDSARLRASLRLTLRIAERMRAQGYGLEDWEVPEREDDAALNAFIKRRNRTTYHYSSTCRMGDGAKDSVVNSELRVHGVRNLRVADSSIFPEVLATHLQAPVVAVGEKCADMILRGRMAN
ncbi:alcohol oxidase [Leucogyrophana mollusca]|uniref:Alcohol oxidase n=1 Tax=Leucogyrophana mollusca TaxID=85980 RepID=A0ACB8AYZ2_9AGAM|nr:alcohol oxidase [Leucogyrophana mollusca]